MKPTKRYLLKNLEPGQTVSIINCVETGVVVRRIKKNVYLVRFKGKEIEFERRELDREKRLMTG